MIDLRIEPPVKAYREGNKLLVAVSHPTCLYLRPCVLPVPLPDPRWLLLALAGGDVTAVQRRRSPRRLDHGQRATAPARHGYVEMRETVACLSCKRPIRSDERGRRRRFCVWCRQKAFAVMVALLAVLTVIGMAESAAA